MKKITYLLAFALLFVLATSSVNAVKPAETCATIQSGTILDSAEETVTLGYDQWGYNYQANMFNGWYNNAGRPTVPVTGGDRLMMKWNNAWLSSKDCDGDKKLDRHFGYPSYIGSGAWLTNHASGTYMSKWYLTGSYVLSFNYLGGLYVHDMVINQTDGAFSGTGGYPSVGPYSTTWTVEGTVAGDTVAFKIKYDGSDYYVDATGTISADGVMSGNWSNEGQEGTWTATSGTASRQSCSWNDFVKIVAVPINAVSKPDGYWYTSEGVQIGQSIWGEFAIIQEVSSDPCGEFDLVNYKSELRSGLGNWAN